MNKKVIALSLAVFVFVVLAVGIVAFLRNDKSVLDDDKEDDQTEIIPETLIYDDVISEPIYDKMPDGVYYTRVTKKTVLNTDNGSRLVLIYPQFSGFEGLNYTSELNSLIVDHNQQMLRKYAGEIYKMVSHGAKATYDIESFEITYIDSQIVSILFYGSFYAMGENIYIDTGAKKFAYSLNIDLDELEVLTTKELLSDFLSLKTSFINGDLNFEYGADDLLKNITYSEMFYQYRSDYEIYPDIYFTFEGVNVIISLNSDLGGVALFSDTKENSRKYINSFLSPLVTYYS